MSHKKRREDKTKEENMDLGYYENRVNSLKKTVKQLHKIKKKKKEVRELEKRKRKIFKKIKKHR